MPKLNLKTASFADLIAMRDQIQTVISERAGGERADLQKRLDALAAFESNGSAQPKRRGRPPGAATSKRRAKVQPKYRGPDGELWSGRGLAPRWLTALEKDGKKRDSFLIDK